MEASKTSHQQTFLDMLNEEIRSKSGSDSLPYHTAAVRVLLQWLGYQEDSLTFLDGQDRGLDAWLSSGDSIDIFQVKTHDLNANGILNLSDFNGDGVHDLLRARDFLMEEKAINIKNAKLKQLLHQWDSITRNYLIEGKSLAIPITLHLVIFGDELTSGAKDEFRTFQASIAKVVSVGNVPVQFHAVLHTANDIIDERWREKNRQWTDLRGNKYDKINLRPWNNSTAISDDKNAVFYCSAIDLVNSYEALGYQLFEPNVRANIKTSRVNQAIRDSVLHQRTRRDFRFLNNGVTITCDSFVKPSQQKQNFSVLHPGIVNGLQTVVALYTAYHLLSDKDKEDFQSNCSMLVRLLINTAVDDIRRVVKATNNQNPMRPRNLVSNNTEQLQYAQIFSTLNWFYEAKEGAWDAFDNDPRRWRPPLDKQPKDFRVTGRRIIRKIDNEDLAQIWLGFIGFAPEAVNEKKALFDDRFYSLIFTQQTRLHGFDYDFSMNSAREKASDKSPDASLMLVAYLAFSFVKGAVPSASENRQEACARLNIDASKMTKSELDTRLSRDNHFLLNQVLGGMALLFTEYCGFVLYRALGENLHRLGQRILSNHNFAKLAADPTIEEVNTAIKKGDFAENDVLAVLWLAFVDTVEDLLSTGWEANYQAAPIKVRFIFSKETREKLYREVTDLDSFMQRRSPKKDWATGVNEGEGFFSFIKRIIND